MALGKTVLTTSHFLLKDNLENCNDKNIKKTYEKRKYTYFTVMRPMISYYIYVFMYNLVSLIFSSINVNYYYFLMLYKIQFSFTKNDWFDTLYREKVHICQFISFFIFLIIFIDVTKFSIF